MEVCKNKHIIIKIVGALLYFFLYSNAFSFSSIPCTKIIYTASKIKKYSEKSFETRYLSVCKYYAYNSYQLYKNILEEKLICPCINLKKTKLSLFLAKAENSIKIDDCKQFTKKALNKLNLIVDDIINCKKLVINYYLK